MKKKTVLGALSVGEVAARSGVAVSTLHFYESKALIKSWRNAGNQRRYSRDVLRRVAIIRTAQALGISLAEIKQALDELPSDHAASTQDWQRLSERWRASLELKIERLQRLRDHLDGCIGCGCLSLTACPLRNPGDRLARLGPGAPVLDPERIP